MDERVLKERCAFGQRGGKLEVFAGSSSYWRCGVERVVEVFCSVWLILAVVLPGNLSYVRGFGFSLHNSRFDGRGE